MTIRNVARVFFLLAVGWNACRVARADSAIVAAWGGVLPGAGSGLAAMYSASFANSELAAEHLFSLPRASSSLTGLGIATLEPDELSDLVFALPFNFSGAWVTSFSNLNLPARIYWEMVADPRTPADFRDWVASMPPVSEATSAAAM
jgi:hypothetical protein